jgi:hypothetical protein
MRYYQSAEYYPHNYTNVPYVYGNRVAFLLVTFRDAFSIYTGTLHFETVKPARLPV